MRQPEKEIPVELKRVLTAQSALWASSNVTPDQNCFFKNIPRRIFKDHRDARGVPFRRHPLYLFQWSTSGWGPFIDQKFA